MPLRLLLIFIGKTTLFEKKTLIFHLFSYAGLSQKFQQETLKCRVVTLKIIKDSGGVSTYQGTIWCGAFMFTMKSFKSMHPFTHPLSILVYNLHLYRVTGRMFIFSSHLGRQGKTAQQ